MSIPSKPYVKLRQIKEYPLNLAKLCRRFIALDFETNGMDSQNGRIIEIGACLFENGVPVKEFSSLVHSVDILSFFITELTGITSEMVRSAPKEEVVWPAFVEFLANALHEEAVIVAHNAAFDTSFLKATLERLGYSGQIRFLDTVDLSRRLLPYMDSHSLDQVSNELNIQLEHHHRALDDAIACGYILVKLMNDQEALKKYQKKNIQPVSDQELEIAAAIYSFLPAKKENEALYGIYKDASQVVSLYFGKSFFHFVRNDKSFYFLANEDLLEEYPWKWTFANQKEAVYGLFRIPLDSINQLCYFKDYIKNAALKKAKEALAKMKENPIQKEEFFYSVAKENFDKYKNKLPKLSLDNECRKLKAKPLPFLEGKKLHPPLEENYLYDLKDYEEGLGYSYYLDLAKSSRKHKEYDQSLRYLQKAYANGLRSYDLFVEFANYYKETKDPVKEEEILLLGSSILSSLSKEREQQQLLLRCCKLLQKQNCHL